MYAQLRTLVSLSCLPQCPSSSFAQSRRFLALPWPFAALMRFPRLHTLYHTSCPFTPVFLFLSLSLSLSLSLFLSLVPRPSSLVNRLVFASSRLLFSLSLSLVPRPSSIVNRQSFCLVLVSSRLVSSRLVCSSPSLSISLSLSLLSPLSLSLFFSFFLSFPLHPFRSPLISGAHRGTPPDIGLGSGHGRRSLLA